MDYTTQKLKEYNSICRLFDNKEAMIYRHSELIEFAKFHEIQTLTDVHRALDELLLGNDELAKSILLKILR